LPSSFFTVPRRRGPCLVIHLPSSVEIGSIQQRSPGNLTTWGYQSCLRDPDNGGLGGETREGCRQRLWDL
ncbi:hypothetical protein L218DRAFT_1081356, partial [Marasmius fiardii PR-910]